MYYASTSDFTTYYDTSNSNKEGYSISLSNFKKKVNLYNTYNVLIADLFTQSTSMTVGPEVETITVSDNKITVNAETTVRLKDENTITHVQGSNLYHSLKLDLDRYSDTGVTNEIYGLDSSRITAKYWLDDNTENKITVPAANITVDTDSNFINIQTAEISNGVDTDGIKINVEVEMTFA